MLQLVHKQKIVEACFPTSLEESTALWHDIKPIKFGTSKFYATPIVLAAYQVPEDAAYLLILRTEVYTTSFDPAFAGFWRFAPPPQGVARWIYTDIDPTTPEYQISPRQAINIYADTDEFLFAKGDHRIALVADLATLTFTTSVPVIRCVVYGYLIGALVADRIGASESTYFTTGPIDFVPGGGGGNFPPVPPVRPPVSIGEF